MEPETSIMADETERSGPTSVLLSKEIPELIFSSDATDKFPLRVPSFVTENEFPRQTAPQPERFPLQKVVSPIEHIPSRTDAPPTLIPNPNLTCPPTSSSV